MLTRAAFEPSLGTAEEAKDRFGRITASGPPPPRQQKIDHFVMLYMENHAADHFFGCMDLPGYDGIKGHKIPKPTGGHIEVTCGHSDYVCKSGPSYDTFAGKFHPVTGHPHIYPYSPQSDNNSAFHGVSATGQTAVAMFGPEQVPIKKAIAENFGVFNKVRHAGMRGGSHCSAVFAPPPPAHAHLRPPPAPMARVSPRQLYTAVPSASSPNHLFTQSATSCGMQHNGLYNDCLGPNVTFPQMTIYDSMRLHNVSFGLYMNSTCGLDGKPCHGEDPHNPDSASAINTPDVAMAGVARHKDRFYSQTTFYARAKNGTLPALSWILPPQQACDHPCHDVAKGERLLKDGICLATTEPPHGLAPTEPLHGRAN